MKNFLLSIFIVILAISENVLFAESPPNYNCYKIKEFVCIDGRLDESCWRDASLMIFRDIVDGSVSPYPAKAKIMMDDRYLYIGFIMEEPDVWGTSVKRDEEFYKQKQLFVKIFIDADGDYKNYMEFHINPLNNIFDVYFEQGATMNHLDISEAERGRHIDWNCSGLKTAVQIDGTLNYPDDIDKGWSVEVAIPWKSIAQFILGKCPPTSGNIWRVNLGCTYYMNRVKNRFYATWPVIGKDWCHILDRWGFLIFSGPRPEIIIRSHPKTLRRTMRAQAI